MGGSSRSSSTVINNAYDNRSFIDDRDTYINDNRQDNRSYVTIDDRDDNRSFYDSRSYVSNTTTYDNRTTNIIDDRDDNRTFIDESIGDNAIVAQDGGSVNISETVTDHGAVDQAFDFANQTVTGVFGAFGKVIDSQKTANAAIVEAILKNSEGGKEDSNRHMVYASLFAGVSMAALVAFRKGV